MYLPFLSLSSQSESKLTPTSRLVNVDGIHRLAIHKNPLHLPARKVDKRDAYKPCFYRSVQYSDWRVSLPLPFSVLILWVHRDRD